MEDEDEEFVTEFKRVINHEDVKYADDDNRDDILIEDPYLNMELWIQHDDKEGMHHARVKQGPLTKKEDLWGGPTTTCY